MARKQPQAEMLRKKRERERKRREKAKRNPEKYDEAERLRKKREQERKRREEVKKNPEKYEEAKRKEQERYLKRKTDGKIKLIDDLSEGAKRLKRKKWKIHNKQRKKKVETRNAALSCEFGPKRDFNSTTTDYNMQNPENVEAIEGTVKVEIEEHSIDMKTEPGLITTADRHYVFLPEGPTMDVDVHSATTSVHLKQESDPFTALPSVDTEMARTKEPQTERLRKKRERERKIKEELRRNPEKYEEAERLRKKREQERKRREEVKRNPEKYEEAKRKEQERYLKRKADGKIKLIDDLSEGAKRLRQKKWKIHNKQYQYRKRLHKEDMT